MALPYGLVWRVSVVISLTRLFADINAAALRMLGYTAAAIAVLAVSAGLLISYLVTAPLLRLSQQMNEVAEMNLDVIQQKPSRFKEIADIQAFFGTMVNKLMVWTESSFPFFQKRKEKKRKEPFSFAVLLYSGC